MTRCRRRRQSRGSVLQRLQHRKRAFGIGDRHEDMIMVTRRHHIGADPMLRQPISHRRCQSNSLKARMNIQRDALQHNRVRNAVRIRHLPADDQR